MFRTLIGVAVIASALPAHALAQDTLIAPRAKGSLKAPVTVYEMSDFQCPFCRRFALETFTTLDKEYITTGKVRWVFINFPILPMHPNALPAAEFAACAAKQGRFWPAHDLIYATQETWAPLKNAGPFFVAQISSLKLRRPEMVACLETGATRAMIRSDAEGAMRSGAKSTPSFYVEGAMIVGAQPLAVFRQVLDSIYKVKKR